MTKQFRVYEDDLAMLERSLAVIHSCASLSSTYLTPEVQVAAEESKRIISDIRWDYGPFSQVVQSSSEGQP